MYFSHTLSLWNIALVEKECTSEQIYTKKKLFLHVI